MLVRLHIEPAAIPSYGFLYFREIIFCHHGQRAWTNALPVIAAGNSCNNAKDIFCILMEFIIAETETVILNAPHDGCNTYPETDDVDKCIQLVFQEVPEND